MSVSQLIFVILIASLLGIFVIGIIGRNEGISLWKLVNAGTNIYKDTSKFLQIKYVKIFKTISWLYFLSLTTLILYIGIIDNVSNA